MLYSLIVFILAAFFASLSFGIENADPSLTAVNAPEREVLRRVVYLNGGDLGDCSATWLEPGILIGAAHCSSLIENVAGGKRVVRIAGLVTPVLYSSLDSAEAETLRKFDVLVLGVHPASLNTLNLPKSVLALPEPDPVGLSAGTRLLVAGYGSDSLALDRHGEVITDYSKTGKWPLGAAWVDSAQTSSARDYIVFRASRKLYTRLDCQTGQVFWAERGPQACSFETAVLSTDQRHPAIQDGDSGGPAFRRVGSQWRLSGVIHGISLETINPDSIEMNVVLGGETMTLSMPTDAGFWTLYNPMAKTLFERIGRLNTTLYYKAFGELELDPNLPLSKPVRIEHKQFGMLNSVQVNLASPEINRALHQQIENARLILKGNMP